MDRSPAASAAATPAGSSAADRAEAEFVRAVNAACKDYAERDAALEFPEEAEDYEPFMETFIENSERLDDAFARLDAPEGFEGWDDYVEKNREQTKILRAAAPEVEAAVRDDDLATADDVIDEAIEDFNAIVDELDPFAREHGLTECASAAEDDTDA